MLQVNCLGVLPNTRKTAFREMALQFARSAALTQAPDLEPFPGRIVELPAARASALVAVILDAANSPGWATDPGFTWTPVFTQAEALRALKGVGYVSAAPLTAVPTPSSPTTPTDVPGGQNGPIQRVPQPVFDAGSNVALPDRGRLPGQIVLPVIVPPSPIPPPLPDLPPVRSGGTDKTFLWIAGIVALYFLTQPGKTLHRSGRRKKKASFSGDLSGATANCAIWGEVEGKSGGLVWRCLGYGNTCKGSSCSPPVFKFQTRKCVKTKKVATKSPRFKLKTVKRCEKYSRVCAGGTCLSEPMPKGQSSPGHGVNVKRMVSDMSRQMADDRNVLEQTAGKAFGREIMDRGGIRAYRGRSISGKRVKGGEEFAAVPIFMRRKDGLPLDEMASEMGFDDDTAFLEAVKAEYPREKGEKKQTWTAADFVVDAEAQVWDAIDAGLVHGLGQDLFPGLKRELVFTTEDRATSDDPLDIFLQRRGWDIPRVRILQASIAEKAVPDMFTGKIAPLTASEVEIQRDIQAYFDAAAPPAKRAKKTKADPFWIVDPVQQSLFGS